MSSGDHLFNEPYSRCLATHDDAGLAYREKEYLQAAKEDAEDRRAMARCALGHEIPYGLLMHLGAFDARMLPRLLRFYHGLGFHFVSLAEAERDPFYRSDLDLTLPATPIYWRWLVAKHLPVVGINHGRKH